MIKHKLLFVLLSSILLSACAKKAEEEIVAKYEFIIDYSNGIKSGSKSRICIDRVNDQQLCSTSLDFVQIDNYFCDMNNKLHIIVNNERIIQEGYTCQSIVKDVFKNSPESLVKTNE